MSDLRGRRRGCEARPPLLAARPVRLEPLSNRPDSAVAAGLPRDVLVAKAAEGVLKGADDARIVRAVRMLVTDLGTAKGLLRVGASSSLLTAAASALRAGIPGPVVRQLVEARDARRLVEASLSTIQSRQPASA